MCFLLLACRRNSHQEKLGGIWYSGGNFDYTSFIFIPDLSMNDLTAFGMEITFPRYFAIATYPLAALLPTSLRTRPRVALGSFLVVLERCHPL